MYNGNVVVTIVMGKDGNLRALPQMTAFGLLDEKDEKDIKTSEKITSLVQKSILELTENLSYNEDKIKEIVRITVCRFFQTAYEKKPQVRVHLVWV